jgi:basic membrane protein A
MEASILSSRSSIIASIIIVIVVFGAVGGFIFMTNPYVPAKIGVVVTEPGFGDLSMADQVDTGLRELAGDIVVDYEYFTAAGITEAGTILEELSVSGEYNLIVVIGAELAGELEVVASNHLNQKYACIGGAVNAPNVFSATFKQYEAAYLAGVLAALASIGDENRTGTGIIGIIGSVDVDPTVSSLIAGFKQGVVYVNDSADYDVNVTLLPVEYVGSYNDSIEAELIASNMWHPNGGNATIIFAPVRASILGIREAMLVANATYYNGTDRQPLAIAAEGNQDYLGLPDINTRSGNSWIVTSVVPRSDLAVYSVINSTLWDEFQGITLDYNLANGGVNITYSEFINYEWVPHALWNDLIDIRAMINNGTIVVSESYP